MELKEALKEFVTIFGRNGNDIGNLNFEESVNITDNNLDSFYMLLNFEDVLTIGGELFFNIIPKQRSEIAQNGYYRIKKGDDWVIDEKKWHKNWVIFANRNDDGIFFNGEDNSVNGTIDKKQFFKLSGSLSNFFCILNECLLLEKEKYKFETFDDEEEATDDFKEDIYNIILKFEEANIADNFIEFFFG
jgi:hypothetical protein